MKNKNYVSVVIETDAYLGNIIIIAGEKLFSAEDVKTKWYNLLNWYKTIKDKMNTSGEGREPLVEHFQILDEKLASRSNIVPPEKWIQSSLVKHKSNAPNPELDVDYDDVQNASTTIFLKANQFRIPPSGSSLVL